MTAVANSYLALSLMAVTKGTLALDEQKLVQRHTLTISIHYVYILIFELKYKYCYHPKR